MNICIFDTETISIDKPFCYNIGYVIADADTHEIALRRSFVVEQVWHNLPLFTTAYYADKREIYVAEMRARVTIMDKYGYICQQMIRDFKNFNVEIAFAFNSSFDEKVFNFNCDWYKCANPFDNIEIKDIRGFAHYFIVDNAYKNFCEEHSYFTDSGNYSTTAETIYRYLSSDTEFNEAHTALEDAEIEWDILGACVALGADLKGDYQAFRSIPRKVEKTLKVIDTNKDTYYFEYSEIRINKAKTNITLK